MASPIAALGDHPAQQRRRAVALLLQLLVERVERREHVVDLDLVGPLERPARLVVAARASRRRRPRASRRPRRPRKPPRSRAGRRSARAPAPARRRPIRRACRASGRTPRRASRLVVRVSARAGQLDQPRLGERRQCVEADRAAARVQLGEAAVHAEERARASPDRRSSGSASSGERPVTASIRMSGASPLIGLDVEHRRNPACRAASRRSSASRPSPATATTPSAPPGGGVGVVAPMTPSPRVVVVPAARLAAEAPGLHHARLDHAGAPARLVEALLPERLRDLEADVDPDQVHQLERPHPEASAHAHDPVDRRVVGDALGQQLERLHPERAGAPVGQEAGAVARDDHALAHALAGDARQSRRPRARTPCRPRPRAAPSAARG